MPSRPNEDYRLPVLTAGINNQGLSAYIRPENTTILKDVISISANGANTGATFYQSKPFTILQDAYAIDLVEKDSSLITRNVWLYLTTAVKKTVFGNYDWTNKAGWERIKENKIMLPLKNGQIDFAFMDSFVAELEAQHVAELEAQHVAELEAYLSITGLDDYELNEMERTAFLKLVRSEIEFSEISLGEIFDNIVQGRRLKKSDQKKGDIPFVMSGITNTGVANYISNPITLFPDNSLTIDIFGNVFYRSFSFSAGDDTGVYWSNKNKYSIKTMLFLAAASAIALKGKYSYGHKLRSSQSLAIKIKVPILNGKLDIKFMDTLISAIQKLIIKDVVEYAKGKKRLTKSVIKQL